MVRMGVAARQYGDVSAEENLPADVVAMIPVPRAFTIVGIGGRNDILDDSAPLVADAVGLELPSGKALVWCQVHGCCGLRVWDSAEQAADRHGSYLRWSTPDRPAWP